MSNPAFALHDLLVAWRDSADSQPSWARVTNIGSSEGVAQVAAAFGLIARLSASIDEAESHSSRSLDIYRTDVEAIFRIVIGRTAGSWTSGVNGEAAVPAKALDDLLRLGHYLDGKVIEISGERERGLRDSLGEISEAIRASALSPELEGYLTLLIREISAALDDELLGARFDFGEAIRRLWVCLGAAANDEPDQEKKNRFSALREKIAPGVATTVASTGIIQGSAVIFSALTQSQ